MVVPSRKRSPRFSDAAARRLDAASAKDVSRAYGRAKRYLSYGTRSTGELTTYLRACRVSEGLIPPVVDRCVRDGLLDDRACTKLWATRLADRGYATDAIRRQLLAKQLSQAIVDMVLKPFDVSGRDADRALAAVRDRVAQWSRVSVRRAAGSSANPEGRVRRRASRFLAQRGFDSDTIDEVLDQAFHDETHPV